MMHHEPREAVRNLHNQWPAAIRARVEGMLREGYNAREIRELTGVPLSTTRYWREELGLPSHCRAESRRKYVAEHVHGQTDKQMAAALGCSPRTVVAIRRKLGLDCCPAQPKILGPEHYEVISLLASKGYTQAEIGTLMGVHQTVISRYQDEWRIKPCNRDLKACRSWANDKA